MTVTHNTAQVMKEYKAVQKRFAFASRKTANRAAREIRDSIRSQIPRNHSPAGNFEGYAATGALWRDVVATEPKRRSLANDWEASVVVRGTGNVAKYARIHNVGGIIRARPNNRAGGYLVFKVRGQWVKVKQVRIRRKNYMADGFNLAMRDMKHKLQSEFIREIR